MARTCFNEIGIKLIFSGVDKDGKYEFGEVHFMTRENKEIVVIDELSRPQNATLNKETGSGSNIKYNPYNFTEHVIELKI